jgi:hypothetical protein
VGRTIDYASVDERGAHRTQGATAIRTPQSMPPALGFAGPFGGAAVNLAKALSKSMSSIAVVGARPNCPAPAARNGFGLMVDAIELAFADQLDRRAAAENAGSMTRAGTSCGAPRPGRYLPLIRIVAIKVLEGSTDAGRPNRKP